MKWSFVGLLVLALVAVIGCYQGTPGGPGVATDPTAKAPYLQADDTFNLSVPQNLPHLSTSLKQGETKAVTIGIKRGKNFDEDVALKFADMPKGVTLAPASPVIKHGDTEAKFMLTAADDASLGDFMVKVTGHPTKGTDSSNEFKISVAQK